MQIYSYNSPSTLRAIQGINHAQEKIEDSLSRLSRGKALLSAADDIAGLAASTRLEAQILGLSAATKNMSGALAILDTADSALDDVADMINRIKELAIQASTSTLASTDRNNLSTEAAELESELESISATTSYGQDRLLTGAYQGRLVQSGANMDDSFAISIGSSAPSSLGSYTSTGPTRDALAAAQTAATNTTEDANDIVLTANGADTTIDVADGDSAKTVAQKVNAVTPETEVFADARTYALLFSTSASSANYTIAINGATASTFSISSSNVTDAVTKINLVSSTTGVTATATAENKVLLYDADGDDITVENTASGGDLDVQAIQRDGTTTQGSAVSLGVGGSTNNDATRVIGTLRLYSDKSFTISQSGSSSTGYANSGIASLEPLTDIDLSSSASAVNSLAIIEGAANQIAALRAEIGAAESRLGFAKSIANSSRDRFTIALAEIEEVDYAIESAALAKAMVLQQVNTALLAQANAGANLITKLIGEGG